MATLAVAVAGLLAPSAALAAPGDGLTTSWDGDTLHVAWDGSPYTTSTESFVGVPVTVPGDRAVRTLDVVNEGPSAGTLRAWIVDVDLLAPQHGDLQADVPQGVFYDDLTLAWTSASQSSQATFTALAAAGRTAIAQTHLAQGATTQLTIAYHLPIAARSGNRSNAGPLSASFAVLLEIRGDEPTTGGGAAVGGTGILASTGAQVLGVLGLAAAVVAVGLLLLLVARRRRRDDPAQGVPDAR